MDEMNPLSSLAQKRRISAVGPGGIKKDRATDEVRDIHHSHYGRICIIETPEGGNIGLINALASAARVNDYGFIETAYRLVNKEKGIVTNDVVYLMADEDEHCYIAQATEPLNADGSFKNDRVVCRYFDTIVEVNKDQVDYMDVTPGQLISIPASLIPFLENDDTARALMGDNMQRQAVPLIKTEAPVIATGIEHKIAKDNGAIIWAKNSGTVTYADGNRNVVIFTGLLQLCESEDELAFILSHEIAHIAGSHIAKGNVTRVATNVGAAVAKSKLSGIRAKVSKVAKEYGAEELGINSDIVGTAVDATGAAVVNYHSRAHEIDADTVGMDIMKKANYNPMAGIAIMYRIGDDYNDIFVDHPSTDKRVSKMFNHATDKYPTDANNGYKSRYYIEAIGLMQNK